MKFVVVILLMMALACSDPVVVDITETDIHVETSDGQRVRVPMEAVRFNGLENLPTPTPVPTATPTPEPTPATSERRNSELSTVVANGNIDLERTTIETRTVSLPMAGEVKLTILWDDAATKPESTMDDLERSVSTVEGFMGLPFPDSHVIVWFTGVVYDLASFDSDTCRGYGSYISDDPVTHWVSACETGTGPVSSWVSLLAHEVSHYYWHSPKAWDGDEETWGRPTWIEEGAAEFLSRYVEYPGNQFPRYIYDGEGQPEIPGSPTWRMVRSEYCARTIAELGLGGRGCAYWMGELLFNDLYHTLGEAQFLQVFRTLYLYDNGKGELGCHTNWPIEYLGQQDGICRSRTIPNAIPLIEAVQAHVPEEDWSSVERVIEFHYGALE